VVLEAVITQAADIDDLEVLEGPPVLVVPAVNAVREWNISLTSFLASR